LPIHQVLWTPSMLRQKRERISFRYLSRTRSLGLSNERISSIFVVSHIPCAVWIFIAWRVLLADSGRVCDNQNAILSCRVETNAGKLYWSSGCSTARTDVPCDMTFQTRDHQSPVDACSHFVWHCA
jgi:hypothetical protein